MPKPEETELAAILDAPENASSDAARLEALSAAFSSKASALRRVEKKLADAHANAGVVKIQRDAAKADLAKATAVKDKLEALCRELQLANKTVVADAKAAALSEAERREQLSKQFESGLEGISSKLETHAKERESFAKENDELRAHLKSLLERSDLQEAHFQKAKQTFDLEKQLLAKGAETVVLCGFLTNCCVESTMRTAFEKGFNTITLTDCCATTSADGHKGATEGTFGLFSTPMTAEAFLAKL